MRRTLLFRALCPAWTGLALLVSLGAAPGADESRQMILLP
jgi:hypothetical protein